jgi:hypothetical protein
MNLDSSTVASLLRGGAEEQRLDNLKLGCTRALLEGDFQHDPSIYTILPAGADPEPLIFTPLREFMPVRSFTAETKRQLLKRLKDPGNLEHLSTSAIGEGIDDAEMQSVDIRDASDSVSIQEAVLDLLLSTLLPDKLCLAHYLLGIDQIIRSHSPQGHESGIDISLGRPDNCLGALLYLLHNGLIGHNPLLACKCFEIIYHLSTSKLVSQSVLALLRSRNVNFFQRHLQSIGQLLLDLQQSQPNVDLESFIAVKNSMAWLLKICAVEALTLSRGDLVQDEKYSAIFELFYLTEEDAAMGLDIPMLIAIIRSTLPLLEEPAHSMIPKDVLAELIITKSVANGGKRLFQGKAPLPCYGHVPPVLLRDYASALGRHSSVDEDEFSRLLNSELQLNAYNHMTAVDRHLCQGWRQLVGTVVHSCKEKLILFNEEDVFSVDNAKIELKIRLIVENVIFPFIAFVLKNTHDLWSIEELSGSLLSLVAAVLNSPQQTALSSELLGSLVHSLITIYISKSKGTAIGGVTASGMNSSLSSFKAAVCNCLLMAMRYGAATKRADAYRLELMVSDPLL